MSASDFLTALGTGSGLPRALCALAMTLRFPEVRRAAAHMGAALQGIFVGQGPRALPGSVGNLGSGRCRHRPLRKRNKRYGAEKNPPVTASPCQPPLGKGAEGMGDGLPRAVCAPAMTLRFTEVRCAAAHMGAALQGIFVGQGPRALPGSAGKLDSG